jgi:Helix-turn-helix domain
MAAYATPLRQAAEPVGLRPMLGLTRDEVMTAREVADLLKMPVSTIYELARRGDCLRDGSAELGGSCGRGSRSF